VAIALGSNLGDRRAHLEYACRSLERFLAGARCSSLIETDPVDVGSQPRFLNGAVVGETDLPPRPLLDALLAIERARGRERLQAGAARTLDLDLILYGDRIVDEPGLQVPHPRFRDRRFVLAPLAEIAPDWRDPASGLDVRSLLTRLDTAEHT
jgi:2-amino-4-hydroxy-6-hydroxymethyldihydropteridine diphosphokinase